MNALLHGDGAKRPRGRQEQDLQQHEQWMSGRIWVSCQMCRKLINLYMYFSSRPDNGNGSEDEDSITLSLDKRKSTVQEGTNQLADVGGISYSKYLQGQNMSFALNPFPLPFCVFCNSNLLTLVESRVQYGGGVRIQMSLIVCAVPSSTRSWRPKNFNPRYSAIKCTTNISSSLLIKVCSFFTFNSTVDYSIK